MERFACGELYRDSSKRKVKLFFDFAAPKFGDVGKSMYLCGVMVITKQKWREKTL